MSILDKNEVDSIGLDNKTGKIILTISDHLEWEKPAEHLMLLQDKINTYITFIESEQIYQEYPEAIGRGIKIEIVSKYSLVSKGIEFLNKVRGLIDPVEIEQINLS